MEMLFIPICILAASLTVGIMLNKLINRRIENHLNIDENSWFYIFINALRGVPVSLCLVVGLYWIVNTINIIEPLTRLFSYILFTVIILSITRVAARTINGFISLHIESSQQKLPKTTLLNTILNVVIYAMGVLVVLQYYGISIAPILTAMGVGGMAVALALQETLANIFSGLHLILSKQLRLDDYIKLSTGEEGRVTDITWRFTTIVPAGGGNMIVIPNQKIASSNITNYSMPRKDIVISIPVGVAYDSDLDKVERVTLDVAKEVMAQIDKDVKMEPAVRFHTFGESSIDFNVVLHSSYFEHQFLLKHEFIKALTRRYREEGIEIPYPTRTVLQPEEPATR
ncbi:MAG: mechanosensitive ion channel family protein [Mitsuokella jalaludinii]|nr:mechanosensitive ion channel family protein [Mitsuokella jalaludinii]MCB5724625.1 mechanosensitive ion channel family protein [Mitsuokella jalaludinii]MCI6611777.1 mechanosensitive ion channel family protein [Mitsuokella jalaludinii]MCI7064530.1 mechanosensitive ion channel family protein [Mitsuokella jalaludinii]MCI7715699.1 mechanosensitive ion channel family protein [Mitsuokella jalaludinii]MCQ1532775.1 mechanosensitive ion channel family protein [Mitsuokella jalaludinii]